MTEGLATCFQNHYLMWSVTKIVCIHAKVMLMSKTSAGNKEILEFLESYAGAIQERNADTVMKFYERVCKQTYERAKSRFREWITAYSNYEYSQQISSITSIKNGFEVVLLRKLRYNLYERPFLLAEWILIDIKRSGLSFKIAHEEPMDYAKHQFIELQLDLLPKKNILKATAKTTIERQSELVDTLYFNLNRGFEVNAITDSKGNQMKFTRIGQSICIPLAEITGDGNRISLSFAYEGKFFNEAKEFGYTENHIGQEGSYANTFSYWYPRLATENSKSKGKITFTVPSGTIVACNGKLVDQHKSNKRADFSFEFSNPMIFVFGAAEYFHRMRNVEGIDINVYFLKEAENRADFYIENIAKIISFLKNDVYGMFPYNSYSIVEIPSITGSVGLSEEGMNFFTENLLKGRFRVVGLAHEIGHFWWGNWVQAKSKIIDEGLAQLSALLYIEHLAGESSMRKFLKYAFVGWFQSTHNYFATIYNTENELPLSTTRGDTWIPHTTANSKGVFVHIMLKDLLGKELFCKGLRQILRKYAHKLVDLGIFQKEMEEASGLHLDWFFRQWFYRKGAPRFDLEYKIDLIEENKYLVEGLVKQDDPPYIVSLDVQAEGEKNAKTVTLQIDSKEKKFAISTNFKPERVVLDPNYKVLRMSEEFADLGHFAEGLQLCLLAKKYQESVEAFQKQLMVKKDHFITNCWMAYIYSRFLNNFNEALKQLEHIIENVDPKGELELYLPFVYVLMGNVLDIKGERKKAMESYKKVLEIDRIGTYHEMAKNYLKDPFK